MARRLVLTAHTTLDGVAEDPGSWTALDDTDGDELLDALLAFRAEEVGLLLGRRTFEQVRADWAGVPDDPTGTARHLDRVEKYVVSSTLAPAWGATVLRGGDGLADDVAEVLKTGPAGDVGVVGSVALGHALLAAELVDELRLIVHPVVAGRGRRLFPAGPSARGLTLVESRALRSGITVAVYRWR